MAKKAKNDEVCILDVPNDCYCLMMMFMPSTRDYFSLKRAHTMFDVCFNDHVNFYCTKHLKFSIKQYSKHIDSIQDFVLYLYVHPYARFVHLNEILSFFPNVERLESSRLHIGMLTDHIKSLSVYVNTGNVFFDIRNIESLHFTYWTRTVNEDQFIALIKDAKKLKELNLYDSNFSGKFLSYLPYKMDLVKIQNPGIGHVKLVCEFVMELKMLWISDYIISFFLFAGLTCLQKLFLYECVIVNDDLGFIFEHLPKVMSVLSIVNTGTNLRRIKFPSVECLVYSRQHDIDFRCFNLREKMKVIDICGSYIERQPMEFDCDEVGHLDISETSMVSISKWPKKIKLLSCRHMRSFFSDLYFGNTEVYAMDFKGNQHMDNLPFPYRLKILDIYGCTSYLDLIPAEIECNRYNCCHPRIEDLRELFAVE